MTIEIQIDPQPNLAEYASIPVAFEVREIVDVNALDRDSTWLPVRTVTPRVKDYDALPHNDPASWASRFDIAGWTFLAAYDGKRRVGGGVVATEPADVIALGGRSGNGLLWDLRVAPDWRRRGVGRALLAAAEEVIRMAGARGVDVETQETNVPACRLYWSCGYRLLTLTPHGYGEFPDETKLLWTKSFA